MFEDKDTATNNLIIKAVSKYFKEFSIIKQTGFWDGKRENSQNTIIIAYPGERDIIQRLAEQIKSIGRQECVLVSETDIKTKLI